MQDQEVQEILRTYRFSMLGPHIMALLISAIVAVAWIPNSESWRKFKETHGLNPNPLLASMAMLSSIKERWIDA